jgi:hypothetical protein
MNDTSASQFRRPALLFPTKAEEIPGDPDPQELTELAHSSARALLHGVYDSPDQQVVDRVLHLVRNEGLDDLVALWSGSPAVTLPGALWRLYVLHTWAQQNGEDVTRRYREGSTTVPGLRYLAGVAEPPDVDQVRKTMDQILQGAFTGDLALALRRAGAVAVVCAHGTAHMADAELTPEAQQEMTRQADRLLTTGEDRAAAARQADSDRLD